MAHVREGLTFHATAGCIALMTGIAVSLIIYAAMTLVSLVPPVSAQSVVSLAF
jgi:uncharacterized membrane protein